MGCLVPDFPCEFILTAVTQALVIRLDRSEQGVVPRTCLSARPLQPRTRPPGGGPAPRSPMSPAGGNMSPAPSAQPPRFYPQEGRPMSPGRPGVAGPPPGQPRPQQGSPMPPVQFPPVPRSQSPGPGNRPTPPRSMSPGPYGPPGMQKPPAPMGQRMRSNSASGAIGNVGRVNEPPRSSPLAGPVSQQPSDLNPPQNRDPPSEPVPGQAI